MKKVKVGLAVAGLLAAVALAAPAYAGTDTVTWIAPTLCDDGSPVTNCPVTGYRVEVAKAAAGATWTVASTPAASVASLTITGTPSGTRCYRLFALSASGDSLPSNVACKTQAPLPQAVAVTVN